MLGLTKKPATAGYVDFSFRISAERAAKTKKVLTSFSTWTWYRTAGGRLGDHLREDILSGKRKRKLKNITIKINPFHITAIKKLATMKSIPYQTLIRHWLAEEIKKELELVER